MMFSSQTQTDLEQPNVGGNTQKRNNANSTYMPLHRHSKKSLSVGRHNQKRFQRKHCCRRIEGKRKALSAVFPLQCAGFINGERLIRASEMGLRAPIRITGSFDSYDEPITFPGPCQMVGYLAQCWIIDSFQMQDIL